MGYNFPIVYGPKTVFYDPPNGTDRKLVVSNRISLCILDMTGGSVWQIYSADFRLQQQSSRAKSIFSIILGL